MDYAYIVSSFHRSGSSMMMRCLEAGGIPAVYDPLLDGLWNLVHGSAEYPANPNGFYHTNTPRSSWPSFHEDMQGKVVKLARQSLHRVPPGRYKLVFMTREPREILASMRKFFPYRPWGHSETAVYLYDVVKAATLARLAQRADYEVIECSYAAVVRDPVAEFTKLKAFGFPIDVQAAAAKVDPELYRLRAA